MKRLHWALFLLALPAFGQYSYYLSDTLTSINTVNWYYNGSLTAGSGGLTSSTYGSLISKAPVPGGSSDYEVKLTLALTASGGDYLAFLRATSNAMASGVVAGSYYAVQLINPT